jgi:hypothetical protein
MKKKLDPDELVAPEGPMNAVALADAMVYLNLNPYAELTPEQEIALRAKKKKIVTSTKKMDRRIDREIRRRPDLLED